LKQKGAYPGIDQGVKGANQQASKTTSSFFVSLASLKDKVRVRPLCHPAKNNKLLLFTDTCSSSTHTPQF